MLAKTLSSLLLVSLVHFLLGPSLVVAISGTASFYGGNINGGNCMLSGYSLPSGIYGTAYPGASWASARMCGACFSVTGPNGKTIKVMAVDKCPECNSNKLDLFENAFTQLGSKSAGIIPIQWDQVPCGITSPILVRNKSGASKWWFSMQAFNSNQPIQSLDVSTDGGKTWQGTVRQDYNYFQKSDGTGFMADRVAVRVTCTNGKQVTVSNVDAGTTSTYTTSGNC